MSRKVRIRGPIYHPTGDGPRNGQYALQKILRRRIRDGLDWLKISHHEGKPEELVWFWCADDGKELTRRENNGLPYVVGPNILFELSSAPGAGYSWLPGIERRVLDSGVCRMLFTESAWYKDLIRQHLGERNRAPIVLWPYPIDVAAPDDPPALPPGPVHPARWDLLIYCKSHYRTLRDQLAGAFPRHQIVQYGQFDRADLLDTARQCRCCAYLSDDDRGPLAQAEILLSGCPVVGIERGAPFAVPGLTGERVPRYELASFLAAIREVLHYEREQVREFSARMFDGQRIADLVVAALDWARKQPRMNTDGHR